MKPLSHADRLWLEKSCAASDVPLNIADPVALSRAATVLRPENAGTPSEVETGFRGGVMTARGGSDD